MNKYFVKLISGDHYKIDAESYNHIIRGMLDEELITFSNESGTYTIRTDHIAVVGAST